MIWWHFKYQLHTLHRSNSKLYKRITTLAGRREDSIHEAEDHLERETDTQGDHHLHRAQGPPADHNHARDPL